MPRAHPYRNCKGCGKPRELEDGGLLSARGLCWDCGRFRTETNAEHLMAKQGEYFDHYVRRTFMAAYARVLQLEKAS